MDLSIKIQRNARRRFVALLASLKWFRAERIYLCIPWGSEIGGWTEVSTAITRLRALQNTQVKGKMIRVAPSYFPEKNK